MRVVVFALLLVSFRHAFCQDNDLNKTSLSLGYFGETITHAGLQAGVEYYPYLSERHQLILGLAAGGYIHPRNNTSLFVRAQWGQRIKFKSGLFLEHFLGLGYLHQFLNGGELYEVLPNGAVVEKSNTGEPKFMPSVALGFGYDFKSPALSKYSFFVRPELFWKAPFNGYYLTHFALNTGVIIKLSK